MYTITIIKPARAVMIFATSTFTLMSSCTFMGVIPICAAASALSDRIKCGRSLVVTGCSAGIGGVREH